MHLSLSSSCILYIPLLGLLHQWHFTTWELPADWSSNWGLYTITRTLVRICFHSAQGGWGRQPSSGYSGVRKLVWQEANQFFNLALYCVQIHPGICYGLGLKYFPKSCVWRWSLVRMMNHWGRDPEGCVLPLELPLFAPCAPRHELASSLPFLPSKWTTMNGTRWNCEPKQAFPLNCGCGVFCLSDSKVTNIDSDNRETGLLLWLYLTMWFKHLWNCFGEGFGKVWRWWIEQS